MAVEYGTIGIRPMREYDPDTKYGLLHLVDYDGSSYVAHTDPPLGTLPTNTAYWQTSAQGTSKATADTVGTVKPDGTTTEVSTDGSLSAKTATQNTLGLVKGSNGIKVGSEGSIDINTLFTQAAELANIIAGEAISSAFGKIAKSIAVTMNLNENAVLKSMLTNIDANDQNKIPTSAFIHTLYERIGMGTELTAGANLTAGLNALNSNLIQNEVTATTGTYLTRSGNLRLIKFISAPSDSTGLIVTLSNDKPNRRTYSVVISMTSGGASVTAARVDIRTDGTVHLTDLAGTALANMVATGELSYTIV